jgi:hypothetical protein
MDDLLKDAIADAKAVRETALENAKIALEEAFTPRLQSMLSKKIQSEIEDEDDVEEMRGDDDEEMEERGEMNRSGDELDDEPEMEEDEMEDDEDDEPKMDMENVIEIDGVKYAPVVSEEEGDEEEEEMEESDDFDLDEILKELEEDEDKDDEMDESKEDEVTEGEDEDDKEDVDEEVDQSSGIGSSENSKGSADKSSGIGSKDKAKFESVEVTEEKDEDDEDMDEDIDLEEIVKALSEEEDEEEKKDENSKLQSELEEHRNVVKYLRSKLNEVNLLNAKLLFTNKLFRSHGLSNDQKMKVVETFDRAHNLREVKLVYSTLAESFGSKQTKTEIKESKGSASKPVASTKSEKQEVIAEGHEMRDRFKKLAGIL